MLAIAAVILLAATSLVDTESFSESEASEMEFVFDEGLETAFQGDEIVLDDSLLLETDSDTLELEE